MILDYKLDTPYVSAGDGDKTTDIITRTTGPIVRVTLFQNTIFFGGERKTKAKKGEKKPIRRHDSIKRSERLLKDKIFSNYPLTPKRYEMPVSISLTYKEKEGHTLEYRDQAIKDLKEFKRLLRRKYGVNLKLIDVLELQERGVIHFHCLVFNMPYNEMADIIAMWPHCEPQGVHIRRQKVGKEGAKSNARKYAGYITTGNYLSKELGEYCSPNEKTYFCSKGLESPVVISNSMLSTYWYNRIRFDEKYKLVSVSPLQRHPFFDTDYIILEYEAP